MAKKEIIAFDPPTKEEIMLIQPNNVTFGQYNVSEWQENLLTLIGDKIQKHMTREEELPRDLFNQPYVVIMCDEAGGKNNKNKVLKEAIDMLNKRFSFRWLHPKMKKEIETTGGSVITNIHNIKGTNQIMVNLNPWAIPFLIYYGVGVGGTRYSKGLALRLRGNYTKRIYKIICSQRDRREYYYAISQFRKDLEIPEKHSNNDIDRKILRPAQERIKESGSDVWFDYELICKYPIKGRKPKADTIIFTINTLDFPPPKEIAKAEDIRKAYFNSKK
ncbi:replication initiation protein [Phocaeicola sp.]|uniref:replication initiation protein n=1 Tax=Phocaeicola sp. TaxID=2773926 RepID=UPI003AB61869